MIYPLRRIMDRTTLLSLEPRHTALDWTGLETVYGPRPPSSVLQLGSFIIMYGGIPPRNLPSPGGMPHHDHADHLHQSIQSIQSIHQSIQSINQSNPSINSNQFNPSPGRTRTHTRTHVNIVMGWLAGYSSSSFLAQQSDSSDVSRIFILLSSSSQYLQLSLRCTGYDTRLHTSYVYVYSNA
ncbi:uncharacterized protein K489DRAFT_231136 [Dissoconium aciculare CBS 342.82]|uniref:Uncharacterized protein n=1 Tax=Dissoconium aciculare CBS 342.82 TaxID=1314786 RepID=A0A6J3M2B4_9PEZI|nr:uncharacterized protein K489DRAFT_231136 [Dissoconium aciculare CBS 342.82]KAF1822048.1 hypothetical protein K489DRAFT_231136 [Dissoconium aciculare CBS 342.82]